MAGNNKIGLANASQETRERVAHEGGKASAKSNSGSSHHNTSTNKVGLANASKATRQRVAREGAKASGSSRS